jgi:endonuclease YncB( thermonuclease family)
LKLAKTSKISLLILSACFVLILSSQISLFNSEDSKQKETVFISRVIDGDTLELQDKRTIRLANINSPEKNSPLSSKSISFLKQFENKSVSIQVISTDKYNRQIARIYEKEYLNKKLVELGLASKFLVQKEENALFAEAENKAIKEGKGIWNHSEFYGCFDISIDPKSEVVSISSLCQVSLQGFSIKDESRKIYKFPSPTKDTVKLYTENGQNTQNTFFWNSETHIWNDDQDSAYLFDKQNNIAGYYSYGY